MADLEAPLLPEGNGRDADNRTDTTGAPALSPALSSTTCPDLPDSELLALVLDQEDPPCSHAGCSLMGGVSGRGLARRCCQALGRLGPPDIGPSRHWPHPPTPFCARSDGQPGDNGGGCGHAGAAVRRQQYRHPAGRRALLPRRPPHLCLLLHHSQVSALPGRHGWARGTRHMRHAGAQR